MKGLNPIYFVRFQLSHVEIIEIKQQGTIQL